MNQIHVTCHLYIFIVPPQRMSALFYFIMLANFLEAHFCDGETYEI